MKKMNFKKIGLNYLKELKKNPVLIMYIFGNFFNAILLKIFTTGKFLFRAMIIDFGFVMILASLSFLIKPKRRIYYYYFTALFMVAVCVINSIYYNYYASFVSASLLATSVFVKDVGDAVSAFALKATDWIYLWIFIGLFIINKRHRGELKAQKYFLLKFLGIGLVSFGIGCALPPEYAWSRFIKLWNRVSVVNCWGPYVYQIDDIVQSLKPSFNNIFGYDEALKFTKDYYDKKNDKTVVNEYTGIFDGKNVIAIHAESLQAFTIGLKFNGKDVTPNINKLIKSSMYFDNFYAQVGVGTSSDTEFTYATSLLPSNNGTVFVNYFNDEFVTIQKLLKKKGYYVFSMHGNVGDFWNRDAMHTNMGYDKFYSKSSFEIDEEYGLGLSDKSFFRQVVPKIKEIGESVDGPYYGTLITLTNHTPWKDAYKYSDFDVSMTTTIDGVKVKTDYLEGTSMGNYIKSVNYMDAAIGNFLAAMEKEGLLDNMVIVIYGDHDARLGKKQFEYMYNYDPSTKQIKNVDSDDYVPVSDYDYELSRKVPLIIWSKDLKENKKISTPMGMIDVLPTLGNMLNVSNKFSLGQDIMSIKEEDGIVVFKDSSYITNKIYYSAKNNEAYTLSNGVITDDYIEKKSKYAEGIIDVSNNIITYNLIPKLK